MKVIKKSRVAEVEGFIEFCKRWVRSRHRGFGLKYHTRSDGYDPTEHMLRIKGTGIMGFQLEIAARLDTFYDVKAKQTYGVVELYHPEWFSDIEDMARAFEAQGGPEVTVVVYESATDKAPLQRSRLA